VTELWHGRLLVATPELTEPTFARTVIQLLQHSTDDGAFGLVVNRPTDAEVARAVPSWQAPPTEPSLVFWGGPVEPTAAVCVGALPVGAPADPSYEPVDAVPWLATVDLTVEACLLPQARIFAGYAGWSAGQLEGEVAEGAWWVVDALPDDCFTSEPDTLWRRVLRRQGGRLALMSTLPDDPGQN
jgi:putative transcriptional regulator